MPGFGFIGVNGVDQVYFYTAATSGSLETPDSTPAFAFTADGKAYHWSGSAWVQVFNAGATGPTGATGATGAQGATGATGA